ncbi:transcription initiation factor TFIID subunit 4-like [Osmerus eperlanus]|uniref:transcription initiation factor TFIID subunit 4-like n=1 Tax=Osmerus eperlanus TaxID=29151 RepID=UPI002E10850D
MTACHVVGGACSARRYSHSDGYFEVDPSEWQLYLADSTLAFRNIKLTINMAAIEPPSVSETQDLPEKSSTSDTSDSLTASAVNGAASSNNPQEHEETAVAGPITSTTSTADADTFSDSVQTNQQSTHHATYVVPTTVSTVLTGKENSQTALAIVSQSTQSNADASNLKTGTVVSQAKPSTADQSGTPQAPQLVAQVGPMTTMTKAPGKALVIAVPRPTAPQPTPRPTAPQPTPATPRPPSTSVQLPASFQIPPGMVLIRSDSGQLMLVSQQALAQAQQGTKTSSNAASRPLTPQVSAATTIKKTDNLSVIRVPPPPNMRVATTAQRAPVIKVIGTAAPTPQVVQAPHPIVRPVSQPRPQTPIAKTNAPNVAPTTITRETLENVKKCKNFLVTLIKLASSGTHSPDMAKNVRELVRSLLDGSIEPEEFTDRLYRELKSSPQPYLVPFLKKSLPAVRQLTPNPQLFIQQVDQPKPQAPASKGPTPTARTPSLLSPNVQPSAAIAGRQPYKPAQLVIQHPRGVAGMPAVTSSASSCRILTVSDRTVAKPIVLQSGQHHTGAIFRRPPFKAFASSSQTHTFKHSGGSYREDDDINDVASMAGVNLSEENARILATDSAMVGSVVQSCRDEPFLPPGPLLTRILHAGEAVGVSEVGPDVVSLVSHATQERLRELLEKVTVVAQHRKMALKEDFRHTQVSDVRSQLRFLEQLESLEKQRRDEEEREKLLRFARSRSNTEDPERQLLKQRAKELQQLEQAQLQHREANLTALAAIGPRKKRPQDSTGTQAGGASSGLSVLQRAGVRRVTRVSLRDLLFCMEQDPALRHSLALYNALL